MSRKCGQSVTTDDRWTFTKVLSVDKDNKVHRDRTLGNINKDAMYFFDCRSCFHQSELSNLSFCSNRVHYQLLFLFYL